MRVQMIFRQSWPRAKAPSIVDEKTEVNDDQQAQLLATVVSSTATVFEKNIRFVAFFAVVADEHRLHSSNALTWQQQKVSWVSIASAIWQQICLHEQIT